MTTTVGLFTGFYDCKYLLYASKKQSRNKPPRLILKPVKEEKTSQGR